MLTNRFFRSIYARMTKNVMVPLNDSFLEVDGDNDFVFPGYQLEGLAAPMKLAEGVIFGFFL